MILINIILIILNILILFIGYVILYKKIKKKLINKDIINKVKEEINSIIINLNETTLNNISLIEEKKRNLDKRIILADKKTAGLESALTKKDQNNLKNDLFYNNIKMYSPKDVLKQNKNLTENEKNKKKLNSIDDEIKDLSVIEKATYLLKKGWNIKEIQRKIGISSGELELLMNIENIKDLAFDQ